MIPYVDAVRMVVVVHSPTDQEAESYQLQLVPIYRDAFRKPRFLWYLQRPNSSSSVPTVH